MQLGYRNRWVWVVVLLAVVLTGWWLWSSLYGAAAQEPAYVTQKAALADIEDTVLASGTIRASRMVNVGAQVSGQVKALYVKLGEPVKKGQLIAEIDPTQQQSQIRDENSSIAVLLAQKPARKAALEQARMNLARQEMMWKENATSHQDLQAARTALVSAQSEWRALEEQLRQANNKLATAKTNLAYTRIVAPIDGVVVAVVTEAGQTLNSAQSVPTVVKLAQLDPVQVEAQISEADVPRVKAGMPAWFTILGDSKKRYATTLASVDPGPTDITKDSSGSSTSAVYYNGLLYMPNPDHVLRIAMTAKVFIVLAQARQVLAIPASALGEPLPDGQHVVKVVTTSANGSTRTEDRRVRVGINNRVMAQITSGLQAGEDVVVGSPQGAPKAKDDARAADDGAGE